MRVQCVKKKKGEKNYRDIIYACVSRRMKNEALHDRWTHIRNFSRRYVQAIHVMSRFPFSLLAFLFPHCSLLAYYIIRVLCVSRSFPRCRNVRSSMSDRWCIVHGIGKRRRGKRKFHLFFPRRTHARFSTTRERTHKYKPYAFAIILCKNVRLARFSCRVDCILPVARKPPRDTLAIENASNTITSEG